MGLRGMRKIMEARQAHAERCFIKQRRRNLLARPGRYDYIIVLDNLKAQFNIGKIFRSADAFGVRELHLIGTDFFNPFPAKGSFKWVPARFYSTFAQSYERLAAEGYAVFVLEPSAPASVMEADLPKKSAFVFGHERFGISFNREAYPEIESLRIPQYGMVESLNVSIAASVVMYEYIRQHVSKAGGPTQASAD